MMPRADVIALVAAEDDATVEALARYLPGILHAIREGQGDRIEVAIHRPTVDAAAAFDRRSA